MIGVLSLILLLGVYFPIFYIFVKKRKKKIVRFVLIPLAVLFFPIFYLIIYLNIPYYHLAPFEGKVIDAVTKDPIQGAQTKARYTKSYPSVAGSITHTVDSQKAYTNQNGEFRIPEVSRWFGDKNGNPEGDINVEKDGYARFPSPLSHAVGFNISEPYSDKYLIIELMPITINFMIEALYNENQNISYAAAYKLLRNFSPAQTVGPLLEALEKGNSNTRATAADTLERALRYRGRDKFRAAIIAALNVVTKDEDSHVRYRAVEALYGLNDPQAIDALISALKDNYKPVRNSAARALRRITKQNFYMDPTQWRNWFEQEQKRQRIPTFNTVGE